MPTFADLRADYPLILTLFEPAHRYAVTWSYIARHISPHAIAVPVIRHNQPVPVKISTNFCSNSCASACASSAIESTRGLTPARASFREFQLHSAEQLKSRIERQRANLRGRTEFDFPRLGSFFVGQISGMCSCRSHVRLRGFHMRDSTAKALFASVVTFERAGSRPGWNKSDQERRIASCLTAEEL